MARVPFFTTALDPATGSAIAGASVRVKNRATLADVTLYAGETGPTTLTNPLTTDAYGRAAAWVDRAPLRVDYSGTGITSYSEYRDIGPSSDRGVDEALLAYGAYGTVVSSLPGTPTDGQTIIYAADATNGIYWMLRYIAAMAGSYKWVYLGGPPLASERSNTDASAAIASNTWAGVNANDPTVTLPLAGDWRVDHGTHFGQAGGSSTNYCGIKVGGTEAGDTDQLTSPVWSDAATGITSHRSSGRLNGIAAATALAQRYKHQVGTSQVITRRASYLLATPIRVG